MKKLQFTPKALALRESSNAATLVEQPSQLSFRQAPPETFGKMMRRKLDEFGGGPERRIAEALDLRQAAQDEGISLKDAFQESRQPITQTIPNSFKRGLVTVKRGMAGWEDMTKNVSPDQTKNKALKFDEELKAIPVVRKSLQKFQGGGLPRQMAEATSEMAPYMLETAKDRFIGGGVGAAGGAAVGGLTGLTMGPQMAVAGAARGAGIGFGIGSKIGVISKTAQIEGGNLYADLMQKDVDPKIAKPVSVAVGIVNGLIEESQQFKIFKGLTPGQKLAGVLKTPGMKSAFDQVLSSIAKDYAKEIGEEGLQEISTVMGEAAAGRLDQMLNGKAYVGPDVKEAVSRPMDAMAQAAKGIPLMQLPGAAMQIKRGMDSNIPEFKSATEAQEFGEKNLGKKDVIKNLAGIYQATRDKLKSVMDNPNATDQEISEAYAEAQKNGFYSEAMKAAEGKLDRKAQVKYKLDEDFSGKVKDDLGLKQFRVFETSRGDLKLDMIEVDKSSRKQGIGSEAMRRLIEYADKQGKRVILTVGQRDDGSGTTSRGRLVNFYKRFGFVENKGRNKDFTISEGMYRAPFLFDAKNPDIRYKAEQVQFRKNLDDLVSGKTTQAHIGNIPADIAQQKKIPEQIYIAQDKITKLKDRHQINVDESFIENLNSSDEILFDGNDVNKINLIKKLNDGRTLVIGARRFNGHFIVTGFHAGKDSYVESIKKRGEVIKIAGRTLHPSITSTLEGSVPAGAKISGVGENNASPKVNISEMNDAVKRVRELMPEIADAVETVDVLMTEDGKRALGRYHKGKITIKNGVDISVMDHEIAHAYFDMFTTEKEKRAVLNEIKNEYGIKSDLEAEEMLADGFELYRRNLADGVTEHILEGKSLTQKVIEFFKKVLEGLKKLASVKRSNVERFYQNIVTKKRPTGKSTDASPKYKTSDDKPVDWSDNWDESYAADKFASQIDEMSDADKAKAMLEMDRLRNTPEVNLFVAIKKLGGIKPYKNGFMAEELKELPLVVKNNDGHTIDEMVSMLEQYGWMFEDAEMLRKAILNYTPTDKVDRASLRSIIRQAAKNQKAIEKFVTAIGMKLSKPLPQMKTKTIIRQMTMQTKVSDLVREDEALKEKMRAAEKYSGKAYRTGKAEAKAEIKQALAEKKERQDAKEHIRNLASEIKSLNLDAIDVDFADQIRAIQGNLDLNFRRTSTLAARDSMRMFVQKLEDQGEEITIPQEKLDMLEKVSLNEMTLEELEDVHRTMMRLYHQGKLKRKLYTHKRVMEFSNAIVEAVGTVTKGEGVHDDSPIFKYLKKNKTFLDKTIDQKRAYVSIHLIPEVIIKSLDGWKDGIMTEVLWDNLYQAERRKLKESHRTADIIRDIHKNLKIKDISGKKHNVGRFKGVTKDAAMFIYANSFNDGNRRHLEGSGITNEDIRAITDFLSDEEKFAVRKMIEFYDMDQYPAMDAIYQELEGVHLPKEEMYFPIDRLENISFNKELEKGVLERAHLRQASISKGFTKARVESQRGFSDYSYFDTIYRNWQKVEHYKAYAKPVKDVSRFIGNRLVRQAIEEKFGESWVKRVDKWVKDVAYGSENRELNAIERVSRFIRTNYAISVLGFNISSILKQPLGWMPGVYMVGKRVAMRGIAKFMTDPIKYGRFVLDKSIDMRTRYFNQTLELREITKKRERLGVFGYKSGLEKSRDVLMAPMQAFDFGVAGSLWLGAYEDYISKGRTEEDAIGWADKVVRRTQTMGGNIHLPEVQRSGEVQKLYMVFTNQLNRNFNLIYEMYGKDMKTDKNIGKFTEGHFWMIFAPALLLGFLRNRRPPEKEEFFWDALSQVWGSMFLLGRVIDSMSSGYWGNMFPLENVNQDLRGLVMGKKPETKIKNAVELAGSLTGFPTIFAKRAYDAATIKDATALDRLDIMSFGSYQWKKRNKKEASRFGAPKAPKAPNPPKLKYTGGK